MTLIQRFGGALNLNIKLFLNGVYFDSRHGTNPGFRRVKSPTSGELTQLTHTIARRVGRYLERRGLLERDTGNCYLTPSSAKQIVIPSGTQVYLEPSELVTSKRGENNVGETIRASVWRNVVVDGHVAIKAGSQAIARITEIKRRNIAGKKGQLKIAAVSARGVNGEDILLDGGYHEEGKSRVAVSVTLFLLVAWPLIFVPGKNATLGPGNIFDAEVQNDLVIDVTGSRPVLKLDMSDEGEFFADVMYDAIDPEKKLKLLPIEICADPRAKPDRGSGQRKG